MKLHRLTLPSYNVTCIVVFGYRGEFVKAREKKGTVSVWKNHYLSCESHFYEERVYRKDNNWKNFTIFTSSLHVKT